jgi:putative ABC transport system permease protein
MSLLLKIAFRNILRNKRRSAMTGSAIAVGALALLVFGAFTTYIFASFQTNLVQRIGHLTVFQKGYFLFGAGNPTAYGIDRYRQVIDLIETDPVLKSQINVITPTQSLVGIAGNFEGESDAAKTFIGVGVVPADRDRMRQWNELGAGRVWPPDPRFDGADPSVGMIGGGIARILGLCGPLKVADCPSPPQLATGRASVAANVAAEPEIGDLAHRDIAVSDASPSNTMPRLDLLSATANGAPNVVSLHVAGLDPQGLKELDDNYVAMQLGLAQQLVYGRAEHKATGIVIQLKRSEDLRPVRARLAELLQQRDLDLEVHDFAELTPFYTQVLGLFGSIFLFIAMIMGVIVLFAVVNTMTMNVIERTNEIGTIRAMGVRRRGIRRQFVVEGAMLGTIGATLGLVLAVTMATVVNRAGLTWNPPASVNFVPLRLDLFGQPILVVGTWLGLVLVATVAALIPANRAAKLPVVDALRHV